jgi:hypothetical protein
VKARDHDPQQTQQSQDKERVVEPQPAARINTHQNTCSDEHSFERKAHGQHKRITSPLLAALVALVWLAAGCLPDPQRTQSVALLDQLAGARLMFGEQPPRSDAACDVVGAVRTRLSGEPGLVDVRPAWPALRDAALALQAVCGQSSMLSQPATDTLVFTQARQRWAQGIQREIGIACDHLRAAAAALDRAQPC